MDEIDYRETHQIKQRNTGTDRVIVENMRQESYVQIGLCILGGFPR